MTAFSMSVLRAFVAVGRRRNFTAAAKDLNISQSAVSRHISLMEEQLDCLLFDRTTRHCTLTQRGSALFKEIDHALKQIEMALDAARDDRAETRLRISVSPFLSIEWLTPRLLQFVQKNPQIEVQLLHSYEPPSFEDSSIDLGLNWSRKPESNLITAERVVSGELIPVCNPDFARKQFISEDPSDLLGIPLFHEFLEEDWKSWFESIGVESGDFLSRQISDSSALRKIALSGEGVCLLIRELIQDDIAKRKLITPFPHSIHCGSDYWLTFPTKLKRKLALKRFVHWIRQETKEFQIEDSQCKEKSNITV